MAAMQLMVPTIMVDALVKETIEDGPHVYKPGEFMRVPYGLALQLRALGVLGAFKDEDVMHAEATESMQVYGGDSWFPHRCQTVRRVAEYMTEVKHQGGTLN